jgi:hypothetical protein
MLTATYSLLAIRFEQKNAFGLLARIRHYLYSTQHGKECVDQSILVAMIGQLQHFELYLHARKIEQHVIPVLCCATDEADSLLEELAMLSFSARRSLSSLQHYLHWGTGGGNHSPFFSAAQQYCDSVFQRLVKEDESLMPLVGELLTREDWFALGARFLTEDGEKYMSRCDVPLSVRPSAALSGESTTTH